MKVSAIGKQLIFYDDDGNITGYDPPLPEKDPDEEERVLNIVDYEDRLTGIDPDAEPEFFINLKELEKFIEENEIRASGDYGGSVNIKFILSGILLVAIGLLSLWLVSEG